MKKLGFIVILTGCFHWGSSQSLERQVIGSTGSFDVVPWGSVSSTIGEPATETAVAAAVVLSQGFQQPLPGDFIGIFEPAIPALKVYPNPTTGPVTFYSTVPISAVYVYDAAGKLLATKLTGNRIDMKHLERGVYFVEVHLGSEVLNFRIIRS